MLDEVMQQQEWDMINHPPHYTQGKYEAIEMLLCFFEKDPLMWNACKYLIRHEHKGDALADLRKAAWYVNFKIAQLETKEQEHIASMEYNNKPQEVVEDVGKRDKDNGDERGAEEEAVPVSNQSGGEDENKKRKRNTRPVLYPTREIPRDRIEDKDRHAVSVANVFREAST